MYDIMLQAGQIVNTLGVTAHYDDIRACESTVGTTMPIDYNTLLTLCNADSKEGVKKKWETKSLPGPSGTYLVDFWKGPRVGHQLGVDAMVLLVDQVGKGQPFVMGHVQP